MTRRARVLILVAVLITGVALDSFAQQVTLSVSPNTFDFPSSDPDSVPSIAAGPVTVSYKVTGNGTGNWRITILANGDLVAGAATIPAATITWTATPAPPFQAGTMSKTIAQTVASGTGNAATTQTGTVLFALANSWSYDMGIYSQTFAMTLSAP